MTAELGLANVTLVALAAILYEVVENLRWRGAAARPRSRFRLIQWFREVVDRSAAMLVLRSISGRSADHPAPGGSATGQGVAALRRSMAHPLDPTIAAGPIRIQAGRSRAGRHQRASRSGRARRPR
jgi:hypothetical protein